MNEREAADLVERLVETVPDSPAPVDDLVRGGEGARRRRRRWVALAACCAAVLAVGVVPWVLVPRGDTPGPVVDPRPAAPDPAGAAVVVERWSLALVEDPNAMCALMTPEFQRELAWIGCGDPRSSASPLFVVGGTPSARVVSQDGDEAVVAVGFPEDDGRSAAYRTVYDRAARSWLVDGLAQSVDLTGQWRLIAATVDGVEVDLARESKRRPSAVLVVGVNGFGQASAGCAVSDVTAESTGTSTTIVVIETGNILSCLPLSEDPFQGAYAAALEAVESGARVGDRLRLSGPAVDLLYERVGR